MVVGAFQNVEAFNYFASVSANSSKIKTTPNLIEGLDKTYFFYSYEKSPPTNCIFFTTRRVRL
jgi:hypothetical protein